MDEKTEPMSTLSLTREEIEALFMLVDAGARFIGNAVIQNGVNEESIALLPQARELTQRLQKIHDGGDK